MKNNDSRFLMELADSLNSQLPDREGTIRNAANYLNNQIEGVAICANDPEANNGGCTEPNVSHVLSARLSSRPMAWSAKTLTKLAPILANGGNIEPDRQSDKPLETVLLKATRAARNAFKRLNFAPNPDVIGTLQPITNGKGTSLYRTLKAILSINSF